MGLHEWETLTRVPPDSRPGELLSSSNCLALNHVIPSRAESYNLRENIILVQGLSRTTWAAYLLTFLHKNKQIVGVKEHVYVALNVFTRSELKSRLPAL